jgi:hypothetical protein
MFGINVGQIAKGWVNDALKLEQDLHDRRISICKSCPLYSETALGPICDAKKCVDEVGNVTSYPGNGKVCGCNCYIDKKTRVKNSKCVRGLW